MRPILVVLTVVAGIHAAFWLVTHGQHDAAQVEARLPSVSYNRFAGPPSLGKTVSADQIRADLTVLARHARAVRTYSSTQGLEVVPAIAGQLGLDVTLGIWIDKDDARNEREIDSALRLARSNPNVKRLIVGNETVWRHERTADEMVRIIERVKRDSPVPVGTAENWKIFVDHPQLAQSVDAVLAHIIPYWEGFSDETAVERSLHIYDELKTSFPAKHIVIGEFGWPSAGNNFKAAVPGAISQAAVLRNFVARANELEIDYNIVEAIDQPQKLFEGSVGPYWGILDAKLQPKFSWTAPLVDANRGKTAVLAVLLGVLLSIPILGLPGATVEQAALLAAGDHAIGEWGASVVAYWHTHYFVVGEAIAFVFALPLIAALLPIVRTRVSELAAIAFAGRPRRLLTRPVTAAGAFLPKVSIHVPAYREPPEMLMRTLDAVARLDYPNFECIVVINNTPDELFWKPIEAHCRALGSRFTFVRADELAGFKAGALRLALTKTAADAEIIGVLDADYIVHPDWLKDLVPAFADQTVGLVQAPQDHRDGDRSMLHGAMNAEYAGFFDIGMVERNEANAIIAHGTMCLLRRSALLAAGNWSSDTICEDSDLGLSILEHGWRAHYTNRRYGWGLLPRDYQAFKTQRHRWAAGGAQIARKHWRRFLPGASLLYRDQKHEYAYGWLSWLGAETIAVVAALVNLLFVPFIAFGVVAIPDKILTLPIVAAYSVALVHFALAYHLRVRVPFFQMLGAMFVFMSVQWTVAVAVSSAVFRGGERRFHRTRKGMVSSSNGGHFAARGEAVLATLLVVGAVTLLVANIYRVIDVDLFAAILLMQALPFAAAAGIAALEYFGHTQPAPLRQARACRSPVSARTKTAGCDLSIVD